MEELLGQDTPDGVRVNAIVPESMLPRQLGRGVALVKVDDRVRRPMSRWVWEQVALPPLLDRLEADVLFCPGGTTPRSRVDNRFLVTMSRNMLPFDRLERARYRPGYIKARLAVLERVLLRSMMSADLVIFVSDYALQVVTDRASGSIRRSIVIHHGVDERFRGGGCLPRPKWLPEGDYVLYVSNFEPYKHQLSVVRAFGRIRSNRVESLKLLLVGPESSSRYSREVRHEIHRLGLGSDVLVRGQIAHLELPAVYGYARVSVFASTCENCPNVLLEAMAAGRPLVVSNRAPMPEFARGSALYCDPEDPIDLARKIGCLLKDSNRSVNLGRLAAEEARKYDWTATANRTWLAILKAWQESTPIGGARSR